jgi:DNA phosphorothioation-dependent restriction protein DptH
LLGTQDEPPDTPPAPPATPTKPGPITPPVVKTPPAPKENKSTQHPTTPKGAQSQHVISDLGSPADTSTSASEASYSIRLPLGKNTDNGKNVFWDPIVTTPKKLTNQHVLIVGKSGAGKTQTASAFLWQLTKAGVPSIIFDFQGEYISGKLTNEGGKTFLECTGAKVLDAADGINVNPLEIPLDPHSGKKQNYVKVIYQVANSLARIFSLGDIQHAILRDAINQAFVAAGFAANNKDTWQRPAPSFSSVWSILKHMEEEIGGNVRNLNLRVQPLFETGVFPDNPDPRGFETILAETHVLRLSNLATPELMVAVSRFVLQKLYADMLAKGPTHQIRIFAVVDEAHKLSYEETLTELIREARKYGVGIMLASQSVKDFDRIVFDMVGTKIALQLEGDDAKVMAENLGLVDKQERDIARQLILNQAPHVALVRSNHYEPYIQAELTPFFKMKT